MGYTHHWEMSIDPRLEDEFLKFLDDATSIVRNATILGIELDSEGWVLSMRQNRRVFLNGVGDDAHEDFCLEFNSKNFCKTDRKPYDMVVTAILIALYNRFGDDIKIVSDGDIEAWEEGRQLFIGTFNLPDCRMPFEQPKPVLNLISSKYSISLPGGTIERILKQEDDNNYE